MRNKDTRPEIRILSPNHNREEYDDNYDDDEEEEEEDAAEEEDEEEKELASRTKLMKYTFIKKHSLKSNV
jgi:hypothetical protein